MSDAFSYFLACGLLSIFAAGVGGAIVYARGRHSAAPWWTFVALLLNLTATAGYYMVAPYLQAMIDGDLGVMTGALILVTNLVFSITFGWWMELGARVSNWWRNRRVADASSRAVE